MGESTEACTVSTNLVAPTAHAEIVGSSCDRQAGNLRRLQHAGGAETERPASGIGGTLGTSLKAFILQKFDTIAAVVIAIAKLVTELLKR